MTPDEIRAMYARDAEPSTGHRFVDVAARFLSQSARGEIPVTTPLAPEQLARRFDEPMPEEGVSLDEVLRRLEGDVLADSNHLSHPMYVGHQVSAPLPLGVWTDAVISAVNNSIAVNEMSPTLSHVERRVVRWMCDAVGWGPHAGGTFTSGGSEASFTALLTARAQVLPHSWTEGVGADPPLLLCDANTHYAVSRAAGELGIGMRHVVTVPSERYRMSTAALAAMLERLTSEGRRILAVVATAGQTATGSFDDLEAVGVLCERYGVWLHVDGAHGASALLSERHRHRLRGIERAHSLAWDPHKMMQLPLAGGTVLVRDRRWLDATFTQHAPYLFAPADGGENWNIGVRSFQCSRRADALKAWVALQRYGRRGIADIYDMLCDLTVRFHEMLVAHPRFEPLHAPECNILCFRWSGGGPPLGDDAVQATIRERLNRSGAGWITATVLEGRHVLRVTIQNPRTTEANLARLLDRLDAAAAEQPLPSHGLSAL